MKNFQPGGLRGRKPDLGGRPQSDVNSYSPKFRSNTDRGDFKPRYSDNKERGDNFNKKDVQLFKTNCTTCGKSCEVPFKPDGTKPVLCRDCFATKNSSPTNMSTNRERFTPNELAGHSPARNFVKPIDSTNASKQYDALLKQLSVVETKINNILELISISEKLITALPIPEVNQSSSAGESDVVIKKERKPKKVVAKKTAKKIPAKAKKAAKKVAKKK